MRSRAEDSDGDRLSRKLLEIFDSRIRQQEPAWPFTLRKYICHRRSIGAQGNARRAEFHAVELARDEGGSRQVCGYMDQLKLNPLVGKEAALLAYIQISDADMHRGYAHGEVFEGKGALVSQEKTDQKRQDSLAHLSSTFDKRIEA